MLNQATEQAKINQSLFKEEYKLETIATQQAKWLFRLYTVSISGDQVCPVIVRVSEFENKKTYKRKWHSDPFYTV